jgi:hypothetical protein
MIYTGYLLGIGMRACLVYVHALPYQIVGTSNFLASDFCALGWPRIGEKIHRDGRVGLWRAKLLMANQAAANGCGDANFLIR